MVVVGSGCSKTWTYFENKWHEGNVPVMGPRMNVIFSKSAPLARQVLIAFLA